MGVATGGWQLLFATREKTKARGSPTGRRPYSALFFYGKKRDFGSKVAFPFYALVSTRGRRMSPFIRLKPKAKPSPWGQNHVKVSPPWARGDGRRPRGVKKGKNPGARPLFLTALRLDRVKIRKNEHTRSLASWRKKINSKGLRPWREFILLLGGKFYAKNVYRCFSGSLVHVRRVVGPRFQCRRNARSILVQFSSRFYRRFVV